MSEARGDRTVAVLLSVLLHAAVVGLLGWGWWHYRKPPEPPRQLAIEATVVTANTATPAPAPTPQPVAPATEPPAAATPPQPAPEPAPPVPEQAQPDKAAQAAAARRENAERERKEQADRERERVREQRADEQREREAAERAAAEKEAKAAAKAADKAAADKAAKLKAQAAQDKARREAELRAQLASEERINAARSSSEMASYIAMITGRINRAWIRPPSARAGLSCELHVTQVPGGEVTAVQIASCNGDQATRESIEAAVYRASPLPSPSNPDLFDRNLVIRFHPDE